MTPCLYVKVSDPTVSRAGLPLASGRSLTCRTRPGSRRLVLLVESPPSRLLALVDVPRDHLRSEVELCQIPVMRAAHQADVVDGHAASEAEGISVGELNLV